MRDRTPIAARINDQRQFCEALVHIPHEGVVRRVFSGAGVAGGATLKLTSGIAVLILGCGCEKSESPTALDDFVYHNRSELSQQPSGAWLQYHGTIICDGYLVRSDSHCASSVPGDWAEFEFDDRTYYYVPLSSRRQK